MMGKKSYGSTAVVFVLLGFYFFLVFFEEFFRTNSQLLWFCLGNFNFRYIINVVVA